MSFHALVPIVGKRKSVQVKHNQNCDLHQYRAGPNVLSRASVRKAFRRAV